MDTYTVQSKDCELQAYRRGNTDSNVTILLLHGGPGSGAMPIIKLSAFHQLEQAFQCVYFDQRGSGNSNYDIKQGLSKDAIIDDVHRMVEACKARYSQHKLYLWGGSFGAILAALYMDQYPNDIDGLILSSPVFTYSRTQSLMMFTQLKEEIKKRVKDPLGELNIYLKEHEPELFFQNVMVRELLYSKQNPSNSLRHLAAMSTWFFHQTYQMILANLQCPTLMLLGEDDSVCPAKLSLDMVKELHNPLLTYSCITSCGHSIFLDQEETFVSRIKDFIYTSLEKK